MVCAAFTVLLEKIVRDVFGCNDGRWRGFLLLLVIEVCEVQATLSQPSLRCGNRQNEEWLQRAIKLKVSVG